MTTIAQGIIEFGGDASGVTAAAAEVGKSLDSIGSKVKSLGNESGDGFKKVEDGAKGAAKATQTWNDYLKENIAEARKQFASQDLNKAEAYSASVKKVAESWREMQKARQSASAPIPLGSGDVDALTKAQDRLLNSIARQATVVTEGKTKWLELRAAQAGISEQATPYIAKLKSIEKTTNDLGISQGQLSAAMRGVPAQFTDIITSLQGGQKPLTIFLQQGGQLKDMFGGAGNAARALGGYVLGLVNPFTIAAGAAVALGVAYNQGSKEAQEFSNALITTGNAAGTTKNQLMDMARTISESGMSTQGAAAEALTALVGTGKVGVDNLQKFASVAVQAQKIIGTSIQDTAKDFAELGKSPLQASVKLDEQYNFLTVSIYKQIKALQEQGKVTEAATLAQNTYADSLANRTAGIEQNLGSIERGWMGVKKFAKSAWDEMLGVGRDTTESERIGQLQTNIKNRLDFISRERPQSLLIPKAQNDNATDQRELDILLKKTEQQKIQADLKAKENAAKNAGLEFDRQGDAFLTKKAKLTNEIAAATNTYLKSIESDPRSNAEKEKDIALTTRIAQIREKYKETISKEESAYKSLSSAISEKVALSQAELSSDKPLTESQKLRVKLMELVADGHGKITKAQEIEQSKKIDLIRSNELAKSSYEGLRKELEKFKPSVAADDIVKEIVKQDKAYSDIIATQAQYRQSLQDNAELIQLESNLAGQSATDRNTAIEQYKIQIALNKELLKIKEDVNLSDARKKELSSAATENADIAKAQSALKVQQGEWSKFYQDIYSGLTDSLYRGFEAGKGFFKSFWDGIKNLFKTTVLKLAVQGVMTGALGGLGMGAANAAQANPLGNTVSLVKAGKTLWDGFATAGTIGGGIAAGFGGVATSIGTAIGSTALTSFGAGLAGTGAAGVGFGAIGASGAASSTFLAGAGTTFGGVSTGLSAAAGGAGSAAGLGAGISSALAAIPVWGWAALGAAAVAAAFGGGGDRVTGQQSISGPLGTSNISRDVPFTKSGGMFGKSDAGVWNYNLGTSAAIASNGRSYTDTASQASDTAMLQALNSNYAALQEAAKGYASILGLSADAVTSVSDRINFNIGKTKEETDAAMQAAFGKIANDIATRLSPAIASFSKEGEQVSATMARLAGSLVSVNQIMVSFGMDEFSKSLEGSNAADRLAELTGGIEKLATGAQYFFENFLTDAEKIKPSVDLVTETMNKLGQSSVDTLEEFKQLVQGLDLSTQSGAEMYAQLIAIAPQFKAVADFSASAADGMSRFTEATDSAASPVVKMVSEIDKLYYSANAAAEAVSNAESAMLSERKSLQDQLDNLMMTEDQLLEKKRNSYFEQNRDLFDSIKAAELNKKKQDELLIAEKNRIDSLAKEKSHLDSLSESSKNYVSNTSGIMDGLAKNLEVIGRQSKEVFKDLTSEIEKLLLSSSSGLGETEKLAFAKSQLTTVSREKLPEAVSNYLALFKETAATQEIYTREFSSVINFMSDLSGEQKAAFDARIKAENDAATKAANEAAIGYAAFGKALADQEAARKKDAEITQVYLQPQSNLTNQQRVERQQWLVNNPMSTQTQEDKEVLASTLEVLKKLLAASEKTATATADMASGQAVITTQVN